MRLSAAARQLRGCKVYNYHSTWAFVYEAGMRHARITAWSNDGNGTVKGAWDPDSRGGFAKVN